MRTVIGCAAGLVPAIAAAHPGHGKSGPSSWVHYLTEPLHVVTLVLVLLVAVVAVRHTRGANGRGGRGRRGRRGRR